ncbi:hypothetical protein C6P42_000936, partial [Pichia californica]
MNTINYPQQLQQQQQFLHPQNSFHFQQPQHSSQNLPAPSINIYPPQQNQIQNQQKTFYTSSNSFSQYHSYKQLSPPQRANETPGTRYSPLHNVNNVISSSTFSNFVYKNAINDSNVIAKMNNHQVTPRYQQAYLPSNRNISNTILSGQPVQQIHPYSYQPQEQFINAVNSDLSSESKNSECSLNDNTQSSSNLAPPSNIKRNHVSITNQPQPQYFTSSPNKGGI